MHIEQLDVSGYKHLAGVYVFGPGLTVVTGPNESGKSTLHAALSNGLFGFSSADRRQRGGSSPRDLCRPWSGAPFRAGLTLVDSAGRTVRVDWDFDAGSVEVHDAVTGKQVLYEQPTQREDFTVGSRLLGIEREEHHQLSSLFQDGLSPVEPSENLRHALQRAVEATTSGAHGVEGADERLRDVLRDIGVQSNHYGALAGGRLSGLERMITALEEQLEAARGGRQELDALAAEQAAQVERQNRLAERETAVRQATLRADATALVAALDEAMRLAATVGSAASETATLPSDLPGRVAGARDSLEQAHEAELAAADEVAAASAQVQELQTRQRAAESELEALAAYSEVSTDAEEDVRETLANLTGAPAPAAPPEPPPARDLVLQRFRQTRSTVDQLRQPVSTASGHPRFHMAAVAVGLAGLLAGVAVHPAGFALLLVSAVILIAGRDRSSPSAQISAASVEGRPATELATEAADEDRAWIAYEAALDPMRRSTRRVD